MNIMKRKVYYLFFLFILGISFIALNFYSHTDNVLTSMGGGFCMIALIKFVQYYRISKDPQKMKNLILIQGEERLIFIANKSIANTFYFSFVVQYIAMAIFLLLNKSHVTAIICYITALQCFSYWVCSIYFSKKY